MARAKKPKAEASPEEAMLTEPWVLLDQGGGAPDGNWHRFSPETGPPAPGSGQKANTRCGLVGVPWTNYRIPGVGHDNPQAFLERACQECRNNENRS